MTSDGFCFHSTDELPGPGHADISLSPSLVGLNPGLQSGHLLMSLKSVCYYCGWEVIDDLEVPDDLLTYGVQVMHDLL